MICNDNKQIAQTLVDNYGMSMEDAMSIVVQQEKMLMNKNKEEAAAANIAFNQVDFSRIDGIRKTINVWSTDYNTYQWLSNMYVGPINLNGKTFNTVEHLFQYSKALFFKDKTAMQKILADTNLTGFGARNIGRTIKDYRTGSARPFNKKDWEAVSTDKLFKSMSYGFEQDSEGRELLLSTGDAYFTHINEKGEQNTWSDVYPALLEEIRASIKDNTVVHKVPAYKDVIYPGSFDDITLHSGAAYGADKMFGLMMEQAGIGKQKHYLAEADKDKWNKNAKAFEAKGFVAPVNNATLEEGHAAAKKAIRFLGRDNYTKSNLTARNYQQVKNSTQVIAITEIVEPGGVVAIGKNGTEYYNKTNHSIPIGGTAMAISMGIGLGIEINVFDYKQNKWFQYSYDAKDFVESEAPIMAQDFAGIGTRQIEESVKKSNYIEYTGRFNENSLNAINEVINKTRNYIDANKKQNDKYYVGKIESLADNEVFVFGTNDSGFHGAGSAAFATFGDGTVKYRDTDYASQPNGTKGKYAVKGENGLMQGTDGMSYGLRTVSVYSNQTKKFIPLSDAEMIANIQKLYKDAVATENQDKRFLVAYAGSLDTVNNNGKTNQQMADLFVEAGVIPDNIILNQTLYSYIKDKTSQPTGRTTKKIDITANRNVSVTEKFYDDTKINDIVLKVEAELKKPGFAKSNKKGHYGIAYGDVDYTYGIKGGTVTHTAKAIPDFIANIARDAEKIDGLESGYYNHILINKFNTGIGITKHTDDEIIYLDENFESGKVAVYSIGHTTGPHYFGNVPQNVPNNSMAIMSNGDIPHSVASASGTRYSITMRHIPKTKAFEDTNLIKKAKEITSKKQVSSKNLKLGKQDTTYSYGLFDMNGDGKNIVVTRVSPKITKNLAYGMNRVNNFGNPFVVDGKGNNLNSWEQEAGNAAKVSNDFYRWLTEDNYLPEGVKSSSQLTAKKKWILDNLNLIKNAENLVYWREPDDAITHVDALVAVAEGYEKDTKPSKTGSVGMDSLISTNPVPSQIMTFINVLSEPQKKEARKYWKENINKKTYQDLQDYLEAKYIDMIPEEIEINTDYKPKFEKDAYTLQGKFEASPDQKILIDEAVDMFVNSSPELKDNILFVHGMGGTGKSTTIGRAIELAQKQLDEPIMFQGMTFTHAAKGVLRDMSSTMDKSKIKIRVETTSSFLSLMNDDSQWTIDNKTGLPIVDNFNAGRKRKHPDGYEYETGRMSAVDDIKNSMQSEKFIIVIDESSMIDYKELSQLIAMAQMPNYAGHVKIVLMGDYHQLPPVGSIAERTKTNEQHIFAPYTNKDLVISPAMATILGYDTFNYESKNPNLDEINKQLLEAKNITLTTQNRQSTDSDLYKIIQNSAKRMERELIRTGSNTFVRGTIDDISPNNDSVKILDGNKRELRDLYRKLFRDGDSTESKYITYNNKNVVQANQDIRTVMFDNLVDIDGNLPDIVAGSENMILYDNHNKSQPELTNGLNIKILSVEELKVSDSATMMGEREVGRNSGINVRAEYNPGVELNRITFEYEKINSSGAKSIKQGSMIIPRNIMELTRKESEQPGSVIKRTGKMAGKPFSSVREIYIELIRRNTTFYKVYRNGKAYKKFPTDVEVLMFESFIPMYYSYAISTYKSQGQSIKNVIYDARYASGKENNAISRLANEYTAMSRTKKNLYILNASASILGDFTTVENKNVQGSDNVAGQFFDPAKGDTEEFTTDFDFAGKDNIFDWFETLRQFDEAQAEPEEQVLRIYSQEFLDHEIEMLNQFQKAFSEGATSKISYKEIMSTLQGSIDRATSGYIEHKADGTAEIGLRWNKYNGTARKSEIFMHEMVHFMTNRAYALSPDIQIVIETLQKAVRDAGLTYEIFLVDIYNQGMEPTEFDIQIAKDKWEYTISDIADPEEFFAYAATNEHLFNAIKDIRIDPKVVDNLDVNEKGFIASIKNIINSVLKMINKLWAAQAQTPGKTGAQIITDTMMKLTELQAKLDVENEIARDMAAEDKAEDDGILKDLDEKMAPWVKKFDDAIDDLHAKTKKNSAMKKIVKAAKRVSLINRLIESNLIQNIYTNITQKTDNQKWAHLYRLYRIGKNFTEKHRQGLSDSLGRIIEPYFEDIDSNTRSAISRIIFKIDMPSLLDTENGIDFEELKIILDDDSKMDQIVQAAKNEVEKAYKKVYDGNLMNANYQSEDALKQADGLARHLNDGGIYIANQQLNAENIFSQFHKSGSTVSGGTPFTKDVFETRSLDDEEAIKALDRYITYKALQISPMEDRKLVKHYLKSPNNIKNIKSMLNMYNEFVNEAVDDLNVTIYNPVPKGYFESLNRSKMKFEIIAEDEVNYYEGMFGNMTNIGEYGTINGVKYYKLVGRGHDVGFDEGMISIAGTTIEGISLKSILINNMTAENKKKPKGQRASRQTMENSVLEMLDRYIESGGTDTTVFNGEPGNKPIPVYDFSGSIIDYKIQPNLLDKVKHMNYNLDVVESAKYTFSKLQHRQASVIHNKEVVDTLLDYHEKYAVEDAEDFITIKRQEEGEKFDEDIHGRWNRIPEYTRNYIFTATGKHSITIPKNMMETITGERQVTFSNFNVGPIDLRNNPKIQKMILAVEDYIAEVFSWLKETIAIRMGNVVGANTISNMVQAWRHGKIGPVEYIERARRKWQELNDYRRMLDELNDEKVKLVTQGENQDRVTLNRIKILEQRINKNPFHALVEDGQFSPIIEDVNVSGDEATGHIAKAIGDGFNRNKFTQAAKPIKEVLFLDRNTKMYQAMMKFTQYGDVITREILREKREEDAIKAGKPMSEEERQAYLDFLDQLFVNYSYIDNRFIKYGERILGIFFTKYFFRQAKAMQTVIAQNPARFAASLGAEELIGYDIETAEDAYYEPFTSFINKLGFMHPGRMIDSLTDIPLAGVVPEASAFAHKM